MPCISKKLITVAVAGDWSPLGAISYALPHCRVEVTHYNQKHETKGEADLVPSCLAEEIFLCRLLKSDSIKKDRSKQSLAYMKESVALQHSSTLELMKLIEDTIQILVAKIESIGQSMNDNLSAKDSVIQSNKIDDLMKEEVKHLQVLIDALHVKHKEYDDMIQSYCGYNNIFTSSLLPSRKHSML
nr:E3 ubiquitin-protein ligase BRE1-like 2 isoform X1 [Tanacetum cinerariifolium]